MAKDKAMSPLKEELQTLLIKLSILSVVALVENATHGFMYVFYKANFR